LRQLIAPNHSKLAEPHLPFSALIRSISS
jgi:hypothetical protein